MWHITFEDRLRDWNSLRHNVVSLPDQERYLAINNWWWQAPIVNRAITWDQYPNWPDPWHLLRDNNFCDLAKALGIVYTIMMVDADTQNRVCITRCDQGNLVLIDQGKYILNWAPGQLLNIESAKITPIRQATGESLYQLIG